MSASDRNKSKRGHSSSKDVPNGKKIKQYQSISEESSSGEDEASFSSKDDMSAEELKLAAIFEKPDLILLIGSKKLHVVKQQLVSASPVFEKMLTSNFKESNLTEIRLPGKKAGHIVRFLRYILPGSKDELNEETVHDMLPLAEEYQADRLKKRIDIFLAEIVTKKGDTISSEEIVEQLLEAEMYNLSTYLKECIKVAARKLYENLAKCKEYQDISEHTRLEIFSMRCSTIDASLGNVKPRPLYEAIQINIHKNDGEKLLAYLQKN